MLIWEGYDDADASREFRQAHGVDVQSTLLYDDDDARRALLAGGLGTVDLVGLEQSYVRALVEECLLAQLDLSRLPNAGAYVPELRAAVLRDGADWVWAAPFVWGTHPVAYNPALVDPPVSWLDLGLPEFVGRVAVYDNPVQQIFQWSGILGAPMPSRIDRAQLRRTVDAIAALGHEGRPLLADDVVAPLATGQAWLASAAHEGVVPAAQAMGVELQLARPREGVMGWLDCWCIPREAPNEDLAYAWIDWMIGATAQPIVCRNLAAGPVNDAAWGVDGSPWGPDRADLKGALDGLLEHPPNASSDEVTGIEDWRAEWRRLSRSA
jgi:putative spermidine/putrescine transport system substrate-binding protein/spermidine/putrescine transport system substrate-binding protein